MKIYTKTGDSGMTSLFGGKRVKKSNSRIEAYGTVDELNSVLGIVLTEDVSKRTEQILKEVQSTLFTIGSELATPSNVTSKSKQSLAKEEIESLEQYIDQLESELPELKNFILPGGKKSAALLQFARTICRRAERRIIDIESEEEINFNIMIYFNRLSDLLFVSSRYENHVASIEEVIWNPRG